MANRVVGITPYHCVVPVATYPVIDVAAERVLADEQMGTKDKMWVLLEEDERWLFKFPRTRAGVTAGEHWAEKIAAEIAALLGIDHAEVELGRFNGHFGSLSRRFGAFNDPGVELVHGNDVLAGLDSGYDRGRVVRHSDHTLENIIAAVTSTFRPEQVEDALRHMAGYMVLDALLMNTDRHHENWGFFRRSAPHRPVEHWVAPSFDHASSLGRELTEARLASWESDPGRVSWYAKRAHGGIFVDARNTHGENPLALVALAHRRRPELTTVWLDSVRDVKISSFCDIVNAIPAEIMTERAKSFAIKLLEFTQAELGKL